MTGRREFPRVSRRTFVATLSSLSAIGVVACSKAKASAFVCTDVSALSDEDRAARLRLAYADKAPNPEKDCSHCVQFLEAPEGCGACKLVRGPIHPNGTCKSFAAKT